MRTITSNHNGTILRRALAAILAGVFLLTSAIAWAAPANNTNLAPTLRIVDDNFKGSLTVAAICKYIEKDGLNDLNDVLARVGKGKYYNIKALPGEVIIEVPNESLAVRYFDPTQTNILTPYSDISKLLTKVISQHLNRQIIRKVKALPAVSAPAKAAASILSAKIAELKEKYGDNVLKLKDSKNMVDSYQSLGVGKFAVIMIGEGEKKSVIIDKIEALFCNRIVIWDSEKKKGALIHTSIWEDADYARQIIETSLRALNISPDNKYYINRNVIAVIARPEHDALNKDMEERTCATEQLFGQALNDIGIRQLPTDKNRWWRDASKVMFLPGEGLLLAISGFANEISCHIDLSRSTNISSPSVEVKQPPDAPAPAKAAAGENMERVSEVMDIINNPVVSRNISKDIKETGTIRACDELVIEQSGWEHHIGGKSERYTRRATVIFEKGEGEAVISGSKKPGLEEKIIIIKVKSLDERIDLKNLTVWYKGKPLKLTQLLDYPNLSIIYINSRAFDITKKIYPTECNTYVYKNADGTIETSTPPLHVSIMINAEGNFVQFGVAPKSLNMPITDIYRGSVLDYHTHPGTEPISFSSVDVMKHANATIISNMRCDKNPGPIAVFNLNNEGSVLIPKENVDWKSCISSITELNKLWEKDVLTDEERAKMKDLAKHILMGFHLINIELASDGWRIKESQSAAPAPAKAAADKEIPRNIRALAALLDENKCMQLSRAVVKDLKLRQVSNFPTYNKKHAYGEFHYGCEMWGGRSSNEHTLRGEPREKFYFIRIGHLFFFEKTAYNKLDRSLKDSIGLNAIVLKDLDDTLGNGMLNDFIGSTIIAMMNSDILGKRVIDAGAGDGILSLVALRSGASSVDLIENDSQKLLLADQQLSINGFAKNRDYRLHNISLRETDAVVYAMPVISGETAIVSNIGTWPQVYDVTNADSIALVKKIPNVTLFIGGGYKEWLTQGFKLMNADWEVIKKLGFTILPTMAIIKEDPVAITAWVAKSALVSAPAKVAPAPLISYVDDNKQLFKNLLVEDKRDTLLRVPVEAIETVGTDNVKNLLETFQQAPNGYVELYYMSGAGEVSDGIYHKYGLERKPLPVGFKRTRESTVTLFAALGGEEIDQSMVASRLGSVDISAQDTILSPVGLQRDPAGLIRATILGLRIMEVARQIGQKKDVDKDAIHVQILNQLRNVCDAADFSNFNLTPDDIIALATGNINSVLTALKKLIKLLPITPINADELKAIYEHVKAVITAA